MTATATVPDAAAASAPGGLRQRVLGYVRGLRVGPARYRMTARTGGTLFTDCFAFFVRHLVGDDYAGDERAALLERLLGAQDPATGLWRRGGEYPSTFALHDPEHVDRQLTTFVVSALATLGVPPRHPLRFVEELTSEARLRDALTGLPWRRSPSNACNRAMFIGTFLAYDGLVLGHPGSRTALTAWFEWHDRHARPGSGFWGDGSFADGYDGMTGAAHQYVLYGYGRREPPLLERAVDRTLRLQFPDGRFWPVAGSGSCYELDAAQVLVLAHRARDYRRPEIETACRRMIAVVLASQAADGSFCWARRRPLTVRDVAQAIRVARHPLSAAWSVWMQVKGDRRRETEQRATAWTDGVHRVDEGSLYDTWFRLLTLAQIARVVTDERLPAIRWRGLPAPGWGFLP